MSHVVDVRSFPIIDRYCYLNHAAISPWPGVVVDAVEGFVADNRENGPLNYARWLKIEGQARNRAGQLLGASPGDVSFLKNTSDGLNLIANGLDWQPGDEVVIPAGEFPSNRLPWLALAERGVETREISLDPKTPEASLVEALGPRTRLASVSSVGYSSGLRLDLEPLGRACRANGTLLCVDAIQHLGSLEMDVGRLPVDFVVAGCHKWLLCPEGLALFWSSPEARERIMRFPRGWRMYPDPFTFNREDATPPADGRRFEPGTLNMMGLHAFNAAAKLLLDQGMSRVESAILTRIDRLRQGLARIPGVHVADPPAGRNSGILCFRPAAEDPGGEQIGNLYGALGENRVITARRGRGIRLSPHFYTPVDQIDLALSVIEDQVVAV